MFSKESTSKMKVVSYGFLYNPYVVLTLISCTMKSLWEKSSETNSSGANILIFW